MFDRYSEQARNVIVEAQAEARALHHHYIGTEHILLALFAGPGTDVTAEALTAAGATAEATRAAAEELTPRGDAQPAGQIPFTPRSKKVLELALREALSRGGRAVLPEHLLLGLVRVEDSTAWLILSSLGADPAAIRQTVLDRLPEPEPARRLGPRRSSLHLRAAAAAGLQVELSPAARRLMMQAGARALDDGRTEIEVRDVAEAVRRISEDPPPSEAAAG